LIASEAGPVARLHALWTLEGLGQLKVNVLETTLGDRAPKVRAASLRLAEAFLKGAPGGPSTATLHERTLNLAEDPSADVQLQAALTLGLLLPEAKAKTTLETLAAHAVCALAKDAARFELAGLEPAKSEMAAAAPAARPLSEEEKRQFEAGKTLYEATCLACHQIHGLGQLGLAPPLLGSEWVSGSDDRLIRIVLNGLRGPIQVKGESYQLDMPSLGILDDDQIAAVLTYVRRGWDHSYEPVTPAKVKTVRAATATREDAWTTAELLKVP